MSELKNSTFLRALLRQSVDKTPVWMMRQAGRYLPEYRATREKAGSFLNLCKNPELACEVTLQPLARFPLDAAIIFSDILTIPDAMGLGLYFREGEGPKFEYPIRDRRSIQSLGTPDPQQELGYVLDAIQLTRHELDGKVPLIGFSGSPWTLATYMIEGSATKTFSRSKGLLFEDPKSLHHLLDILSESVILYLNAQIKAGAQAVMIFDTWGGVLTQKDYDIFSLSYMQKIIDKLDTKTSEGQIPVILFTKGGGQWLEAMAGTGCDALGLDWTVNINDARRRVGHQVALQGNLDPCTLYASPDVIERSVREILTAYGSGNGHIFNLGHGIHPDIPPEHVKAMIDAVHEYSRIYHTVK
ncbi:MAG: uroporphyrinogen decarboxylase [Pseudomonadota bacterium]